MHRENVAASTSSSGASARTSSSGASASTSSSSCPEVVLNAKKPWPYEVKIPTATFRPELLRVLGEKKEELMTKRLRNMLVGSLFNHFSRFTL